MRISRVKEFEVDEDLGQNYPRRIWWPWRSERNHERSSGEPESGSKPTTRLAYPAGHDAEDVACHADVVRPDMDCLICSYSASGPFGCGDQHRRLRRDVSEIAMAMVLTGPIDIGSGSRRERQAADKTVDDRDRIRDRE
jgi:hypothetical protein